MGLSLPQVCESLRTREGAKPWHRGRHFAPQVASRTCHKTSARPVDTQSNGLQGYDPAAFQKRPTSDGDHGLGTIRNDGHVLCPSRNDGRVHRDVRGDHDRAHDRP